MYQTLLLDVDGTLLDFEKSQAKALELAFARYGYPLTERIVCLYNQINQSLWKRYERGEITREDVIYGRFEHLFRETGIKGDPAAFEDTYQDFLGSGAYLLEGALDLVQYLFRKYTLYIITNGVTATQRRRLTDSGLEIYMKDIFISGELGVHLQVFGGHFALQGEQGPHQGFADVKLLLGGPLVGLEAGRGPAWSAPAGTGGGSPRR